MLFLIFASKASIFSVLELKDHNFLIFWNLKFLILFLNFRIFSPALKKILQSTQNFYPVYVKKLKNSAFAAMHALCLHIIIVKPQ